MTGYLHDTAGMAEEQIKGISEQGEALLKQLLPSLGIKSAPAKDEAKSQKPAQAREAEEKNPAVIIDDVRAWKASLPASKGPRMVKDLSEFEDFEAKL